MAFGPIEIFVVRFPGNHFSGEIVPALQEAVDNGLVRVIDIVFALKDAVGDVVITEINEVDDDTFSAYGDLVEDEIPGLLSDEDVAQIAASLAPNSSGLLLIVEHLWAKRLSDAVANANGEIILSQRIPRAVLDALSME